MKKKKIDTGKSAAKLEKQGAELAATVTAIQKQFDELEAQLPPFKKDITAMTDEELGKAVAVFQHQEGSMLALHKWANFITECNRNSTHLYRIYGQFLARRSFIEDMYKVRIGYEDGN